MSTIYDADQTTYSRGDDITTVSAWSSSPLGHPDDHAGHSAYRRDFAPDPVSPASNRTSISKSALVGGLIGAVGVSAAVGMALFGNWGEPRPVSVAPGSTGAPAAVPAPAFTPLDPAVNGPAPAPVVAAPAPEVNAPAPAPVAPAPAPVVSAPEPAADGPAPAADPGSPPAPNGPVVIVDVPAPPISVSLPPLPPLPSQPPQPPSPPSPPKLPPPSKLPTPQPLPTKVPTITPKPVPQLCLPPKHIVNGVCQ
jgi:hypothetical protein